MSFDNSMKYKKTNEGSYLLKYIVIEIYEEDLMTSNCVKFLEFVPHYILEIKLFLLLF